MTICAAITRWNGDFYNKNGSFAEKTAPGRRQTVGDRGGQNRNAAKISGGTE